MPTVTKTLVFLSDLEGLVDDGSSTKITASWSSTVGNPLGSLVWSWQAASSGGTAEDENAKTPIGSPFTWESWGVPAGQTVTHVQFISGEKRLVSNTLLTAASIRIELLSSGVSVTGSDLVASTALSTSTDASFQALSAGSKQAVSSSYQASTTSMRFFIHFGATTSAGTPNVVMHYDNLAFEATYGTETQSFYASRRRSVRR